MIYPEYFPEDRIKEEAELAVFNRLKQLSDKYDIYYAKKFVTDGVGKRPEYEIDFIVAIPEVAMICVEVKGGIIDYNGSADAWKQNGNLMKKSPDGQSSSAAHSLAKTYSNLIGDMAVGWAICFPDCQIKDQNMMPDIVQEPQLLDQMKVLYLEDSLEALFDFVKTQHANRRGVKQWMYETFKNKLLRGIGFVQVLSTKIKYDSERFVKLTDRQLEIFNRVSSIDNLIAFGPAGSGKTIIAKTVAQDFLNNNQTVLFLCFNRTLANKTRYEFDKYEERINVATFHSLARSIIEEFDKDWWNNNGDKKEEDFWNLDIPIKMEELIPFVSNRYDALVIDEGQDFKELWYEIIFSLIKEGGKKLIFMDEMQNIFGHYTTIPNEQQFTKYSLPENCRNTKSIVNYLSTVVGEKILSFENSPIGDEIVNKEFANQAEQQKYLLEEIKSLTHEQGIGTEQIVIMLNSSKEDSCLAEITKTGKIPIKSIDRSGRMQRDSINYTTINTYKGLEADIVFIVDANLIPEEKKLEMLYTEASRARFKLYVLGC